MDNRQFPGGFFSVIKKLGIKQDKPDFTLVYSPTPCRSAAVFTRNTFCGCSIDIGRKHLEEPQLQAVVVTSGVANVATGAEGHANAMEIVNLVARDLGIAPQDVLISSTGVIGVQLPMDTIRKNILPLKSELKEGNLYQAAVGIMTTDLYPKIASRHIGGATLTGIAKGAGMIEPNLATMLVYFFTDALLPAAEVHPLLQRCVDKSFNMISIDTDTSTSDTVALLANGQAGAVDLAAFEIAFSDLAIELCKEIIRSGEGTTKLIEVTVAGCRDFPQAKKFAKSIVNSPLVKTAVYGHDPNWGRIAMALGKTFDPAVDPEKITITINSQPVYTRGEKTPITPALEKSLKENPDCLIHVEMGLGDSMARVWGNDLSEEYIKINALYTT